MGVGAPGASHLGTWDSCTTEEPTSMTLSAACATNPRFPRCRSTGTERDTESGIEHFKSRHQGDSTIGVPQNLNRYKLFHYRCGSRARFAENYPPLAHNASWRFEMDRIARTANVSNEGQS